jgi:hypothetical protein
MDLLAALLGLWKGTGRGQFPNIEAFEFREELLFSSNGCDALIHYEQKTWRIDAEDSSGTPLHWESGFVVPADDGVVTISNAQNGGRVEVLRGTIQAPNQNEEGLRIIAESILLGNDDRMLQTRREIVLENGTLRYAIEMATVTSPLLQPHIEAELTRSS